MGTYQHGIYGNIADTVAPVATVAEAGITCVIGTAPVNVLADPAAAVGVPILLKTLAAAQALLGYSDKVSLDSYTIGQAVHATFEVFGTSPLVAINVLDPAKHATEKTASGAMVNGVYTPTDKGILKATVVVKDSTGATTYDAGTDYTAAFNPDGTLSITRVTTGEIPSATAELQLTYSILDPSKVTAADVVAGIAAVNLVFQSTDVVPEILIAPGWSHEPTVGAALIAAAAQVSSVFKATALVDIDSTEADTIAEAIAWKTTNGYDSRDAIPCFPKVKTSLGKVIWMSAQLAALMQSTDAQNESTPFVSPSNKALNILAAVLGDGTTQVLYTLDEANQLNAEGIVTALRFQGWRAWGDNTGFYSFAKEQAGATFDPKDRFINIKRGFDWQANGFITRYWERVDNPTNYRMIQTLITDENQFYNPFITAGLVAGMRLQYDQEDNPTEQILQGKIVFRQYLAIYTPAQVIENTLQFDPTMLQAALGGASS